MSVIPLDQDRRRLAADHLRVARGAARRIKRGFPRLADDFESAAAVSLCSAAGSWDPDSGIDFASWAYPRARRAVWGVLHDHRRERLQFGHDRRLRAVCDPEAAAPAAVAALDGFEYLLAKLPPRLARVIDLTYRHDMNRREVAERIGSDQPYVSRMHARALEVLRASLQPQSTEVGT